MKWAYDKSARIVRDIDKSWGDPSALGIDVCGTVHPVGSNGYVLQVASPTQLGGVQPADKTGAMTQAVGVDTDGTLWTEPGGGSGSSDWAYKKIELSEAVAEINIPFDGAKEIIMRTYMRINDANNSLANATTTYVTKVNGYHVTNTKCFVRPSGSFFCWHRIEKIKGATQVFSCGPWENGIGWGIQTAVSQNGWNETNKDNSETINTVSIATSGNSAYVFLAGCSVEVWYR